jgi:hypothetical protein
VIRRFVITLCVALMCSAPPLAAAEDAPKQPIKRSISLTLTGEAMAAVPMPYRVTVSPAADTRSLRAAVQVLSERGWVTLRSVTPDRRGGASGTIVSNRAGVKDYRAVVLSAKGRVVASSRPTSVTWTPLVHSVGLSCTRSSATVGNDIPCRVTVTPAVRMDDMIAALQVHDRDVWLLIEAMRIPQDGAVRTHVVGHAAGAAEYRAVLMRNASVRAESEILTITYVPSD